jgi:glycine hydroxymethyltransferase
MGKDEMNELGEIMALVLKNTKTAPNPKDPSKPSKTKYLIDEKAKNEALNRVEKLLSRFRSILSWI